MGLFDKLFGTRSQREIKKIQPIVDKILSLEQEYKELSEDALKGKTQLFKDRLEAGETLDDILPEAFAAIREADLAALRECLPQPAAQAVYDYFHSQE